MKEVIGDIWEFYNKPNTYVGIPTNGIVNINGELIMGAGLALQAKQKFKLLPSVLGTLVKTFGNKVFILPIEKIFTFPTKTNWRDPSSLDLINWGCIQLREKALANPTNIYILPQIGTGYGGLKWEEVKPILVDYFEDLDNIVVISREG